jgi:RHS repeat-associated protein
VTTAGAAKVITYSWEQVSVDGVTVVRPTRVLAPLPAGVSACATLVRGCRVLTFSYATATTAAGGAEAQWGDYTGRVSQISFTAWDPDLATPAMRTVVVARYAYDDTGRLRAAWDPRLDWTDAEVTPPVTRSLRTTYGYDSDGILTTLTPPGQQPWQFSYTTVPGDSGKGRLHRVSRSALSAGTATSTLVYGVPRTGVGAPHDLSVAQTARWGQTSAPVDATAMFPPDQVPTGDPATGTLPTSWDRATIAYLDANARIVNTAQPGGHLDATSYDTYGNVVAQISAGNRARALDGSNGDAPAAEAELAVSLSTLSAYTADGARLTDAFGPEHSIVLPDGSLVRGRAHAAYTYDQGAPSTGGPYDLVTTETTTVRYRDAGGAQIDADARTTTTGYDWNLRLPTIVTVDPGGLNLVSITVYDGDGRVLEHTKPGAEGATNTPHTLRSVYYTAAANSTYPQCGDHAEWSGLVCRSEPLGSSPPSAPLVVSLTTYDMYQQRRTVTEKTKDDVLLRTTTISYDSAGRVVEATITSPAGLGEPVPTVRQVYDPATGQLVRTQSVDGLGAVTAQIVRGYDTLGRPIAYTDADGNTTTTTGYDLLSRPTTITDGKGTRTYTYDSAADPRGLPTALFDSQAGTFTARYDADGLPVAQTWPNGVTVALTSDEAGNTTTLTYTQPGCAAEDCTLFTETVQTSVHGQRRAGVSTLSEQTFGYDNAARLTTVNDTVAGGCTTRVYTYSAATNRTGATSYGPGEDGACQSSTAHSSRTWTYDNADRLITPGTGYDQLGRTTTLAASDTAGAATAVTNQYYTNDMVRQLTQDTTTTYTLDVLPNRIRAIHTGTATKTNHYSDDGDNPAWIDEDGWYTRVLPSLAGIAGIYTGVAGHIEWQITNLHGDFVATIIGGTPGLSATHETDEQGQRRDLTQVQRRYGWLGSAQRAADNPGDLITMGVRLYNPGTGRFLSNDPIYGGNANAYDYGHGDGVNNADPSGAISCTRYYYRKTYTWWRGTTIDQRFRCYIPNWLVRAYVWGMVAAGMLGGVGAFIASKIPHWVSWIVGIGSLVVGAVYFWYGSWLRSLYDDYCHTQGVYIRYRFVYNLRQRWAFGQPWGIGCVSWR